LNSWIKKLKILSFRISAMGRTLKHCAVKKKNSLNKLMNWIICSTVVNLKMLILKLS